MARRSARLTPASPSPPLNLSTAKMILELPSHPPPSFPPPPSRRRRLLPIRLCFRSALVLLAAAALAAVSASALSVRGTARTSGAAPAPPPSYASSAGERSEAAPGRAEIGAAAAAAAAAADGGGGPPSDPCSRRGFLRSASAAAAGAAAAAAALCAEPDEAEAASDATGEGGVTVASSGAAEAAAAPVDFRAILKKSAKRALGGGTAGASAAVVQVCSLMWLRTAMNYQYRYGGDLGSSLRTLTAEGGIPRLYQGLPFALVQGPLTRFGDTAANTGVLALLEAIPETAGLPLPLRTAAGSVAAGLWRIVLMPVDTSKTAMQVEGSEGLDRLRQRVMEEGPSPLYQGALASAAATAAGHFPWFLTYNFLNDALPATSKEEVLLALARSAFLGLSASCVSDCVSNSLRVIKTTKQTAGLGAVSAASAGEGTAVLSGAAEGDGGGASKSSEPRAAEITYREALNLVLEKDGIPGLLGRGLKTRLLTNAIQGAAFSVLWKYFQTVGGVQ